MIKKFFAILLLMSVIFFTQNVFAAPHITYQVSVQDIGWMHPVSDGEVAGTTEQSKRLEAIVINFSDGIEYNAHLQDIGWQGWTRSGEIAGTVGESRRMEAIRIRLTGRNADRYDVYYRAHVQNIGWQDWVKNGSIAGTEGKSLRLEALQIQIVSKEGHYERDRNERHDYRRW